MNRRILSAIVALLGVLAIVLAVCSATVWRPSSTASAQLAQSPDLNYVVTEPGVLGVVDSNVTVTATAASSSQPVLLAVGRDADVKAWLAQDPYVSVTGLESWSTLASTEVTTSCDAQAATATAAAQVSAAASGSDAATTGTADAAGDASAAASSAAEGCTALVASGANPTTSDLWISTETGTGEATLNFDASDADLVILAATDGSNPAPQLTLSWPRSVSTPWLIPGLVLGGLLLLVGVFLFLLDVQLRHADEQRRARAAERAARIAQADSVATVGFARIGDPDRPLTRREKRDKERAEAAGEEWIDPRTGAVVLHGVEAPPVPEAPATAQVEALTAQELEAAVGAARGSAVVPGLDQDATAAHRAARSLEDEDPLLVAPEQPEQSEHPDAASPVEGAEGDDGATGRGAAASDESDEGTAQDEENAR